MKYPIFKPLAYWLLFFFDLVLDVCVAPWLKKPDLAHISHKKILVCNGAHLGDVILTTALLPVLKAVFPEAKIAFLIGNWSSSVVENHPLIDAVYTVDHWKLNRSNLSRIQKLSRYFKTRRRAKELLRQEKFDLALDCNLHFPNMAFLLWQAQIPVRIGFENAGLSGWLTHIKRDPHINQSVVETFLLLLEDFQIKPSQELLQPSLAQGPCPKQNYIVIHMGAGDVKKNWPKEKWRALVKKLVQDGENLIFTGRGNCSDSEYALEHLPRVQNLCNKQSWNEFTALIAAAKLLISLDTSAGHVAAAVGTPAVLLYTGIHPPRRWAPLGAEITILTEPTPCSPCLKGCSEMRCIRSILVEQVYNTVKLTLQDCQVAN